MSRASGFSLIEVLAAILILAVSLVALYPSFGAALKAIGRVDESIAARLLAQSLLDEYTLARALRPGVVRGRHGGYQWTLTIEPTDDYLLLNPQPGQWRLHRLIVVVAWPRERVVRLETLQLARSQ